MFLMKYLNKLFLINGLIISLFFVSSFSYSQKVSVKDENSNENLSDVVIFNEDKSESIITDLNGVVDLSMFSEDEKIYFQLLGYSTLELLKGTILDGSSIYLQSESQNLEEVILSVARSESNVNQIAEKVSVIKSEDLFLSSPASGAELLELSPGVRVQKSQGGGGSPIIRGFEANRVLIVIDGVRMNNAISRSGHLLNSITIDPSIIERAEIIFGSSSIGYGSDALGGVIHYYTKSPLINSEKKTVSSFSSDFSSANRATVNSFSTEMSFQKWASLTSISYSDFGDIRMGKNRTHGYADWGLTPLYSDNSRTYYNPTQLVNADPLIQKNTGYDQLDLFQKFLIQLNDDNQLVLNFQYSGSSDISRYDKLVEMRKGKLRYAEWYYGPQKRILIAPQLKLFPQKKLMNSGKITFAYQAIEESRNSRSFGSLIRKIQRERVDVWSLNGDFEFSIADRHSFSYGFEGAHNEVHSFAYGKELIVQQNEIIGL